MKLGLGFGSLGEDVERLHQVLAAAGHAIESDEIEDKQFGSSTLHALHAFQLERGLSPQDRLDHVTLAALRRMRPNIEQNLIPERTTGQLAFSARDPMRARGTVAGKLVDRDGAVIAGAKIVLLAIQVRGQTPLGEATSGEDGRYAIGYDRAAPLNLIAQARAANTDGLTIATSAIVFRAPAKLEINLTTAADGVVRSPSRFTTLSASVTAALGGTPLQDLKENKDTHELTFLAKELGLNFADVASLFIAHVLGSANKLRDETLFGLFAEGTPISLAAALKDLPDAGIDDAFTAQALNGVLAQPRASLERTLSAAVASNILPASYAAAQPAELSHLDALRISSIGSAPYIRGKTPLRDLLDKGAVPANVQTAFLNAYAANGKALGPTWTALRADKTLAAADLTSLETTLNAGELLAGNLPLLTDTLGRLAKKSLVRLSDLALLGVSDWATRITALDKSAASIPPIKANETPADRITRFATSLAQRFAARYPTTAFTGDLARAKTSSFETKDELLSILKANPTLDLRQSNIDRFVVSNKLSISPEALADLKTIQRLHRLSPPHATIEALHAGGYKSAQHIYFNGRTPFVAEMTGSLGGDASANAVFASAEMTYATALVAYARLSESLNKVSFAGFKHTKPDPSLIAEMPDLQALFGSLDYFECDECMSVYGPAAYLVDLLQYLGRFKVTATGDVKTAFAAPPIPNPTARHALFLRRPDIPCVALVCDNTVVIPYIDIVNEVLEAAIAPISIARPTVLVTTGTAAVRRAIPQQLQPTVATAAYAETKSVTFPRSLPFDIDFARTTAYIAGLGTTRHALLKLLPGLASPAVLAGAALGINAGMQAVVTSEDTTDPWTRWGLASTPTASQAIDPKTRQPYSPAPADWVALLKFVPVLLERTGLSLQQLYQLLESTWVTQSSVTLRAGTTTIAGVQIFSPDTNAMIFTGLDGNVLDRATRFLRLWTASGLQMWELDWAIGQASGAPAPAPPPLPASLDDAFLVFLADAIAVGKMLDLPFQDALTFWRDIEIRDVKSHLSEEDVLIPSTYTKVFANPTMLASWAAILQYPKLLSGAQIIYDAAATPMATDLQPLNAVNAALGLSAADMAAILTASNADNTLNLPTLSALLRYARFASSLSLSVADLILWIELTEVAPFLGSPSNTIEFLRRLEILRAPGIALRDLDYLLRHRSVSQSAVAFTGVQSTTVLQSVRDAIAKAIATTQLTLVAVANAAPIVVTTTVPHGLQAGDSVYVNGVGGNTNANGIFVITPDQKDPKSFSLNGTTGNGDWTGGGSATANLAATIETIVVAALAAETEVAADVVTVVLRKTSALPLDFSTITDLLAQPVVDPAQFPGLVNAFTQVAKAAALFTALATDAASFTFAVQNADSFGWLDPSALPLTPVASANYSSFEALLLAFKLQRRQAARVPKLFDVLGQWVPPVSPPTDLAAAIGAGPVLLDVADATNASPIVVTTATAHSLQSGSHVSVSNVLGNTGNFTVTFVNATSFSLDGTNGAGAPAYAGGGVVTPMVLKPSGAGLVVTAASNASPVAIKTAGPHHLHNDDYVSISNVQVNGAANPFTVKVTTPTSFTLDGSTGAAPYAGGGVVTRLVLAPVLHPSATLIQVKAASNPASPIAITTAAPHYLQTDSRVLITDVQGNDAANGIFTISVTGPTAFTLNGSTGSGDYVTGGVVTLFALAPALGCGAADVLAIAAKLHATAPLLAPAHWQGSLADVAILSAIADTCDVLTRYKISSATLDQLLAPVPNADSAAAAAGALQAQYPQDSWLAAVQPVEDGLREARRDALVAYLLGPGPVASPGAQFLTTDDIFNYYLIDPEMCACGETTRLLQPSLAIQQFVQQCFLGLTVGATVDTTAVDWQEWSWRQQYRIWQANREVFLYPENYVLPELRTNASSFFSDLEKELRQSDCDADAVEAAFENYLRKLVGVANLVVAAHCTQTNKDGTTTLHVFARTRGTPPQWYYRTRTGMAPGTGSWTAWTSLNLDITSDQIMPVIWDRRLHLVWPIFKQISEKQKSQDTPTLVVDASKPPPVLKPAEPPQKFWSIQYAISEYSAGHWQPKRALDEKMYFKPFASSSLMYLFKVYQDDLYNLKIDVYTDVINPDQVTIEDAYYRHAQGILPTPDSPLAVSVLDILVPDKSDIDLNQEPTLSLVNSFGLISNFSVPEDTPTSYSFKGQDLVYGSWDSQNPGSVALNITPASIELLGAITNPRVVLPQQENFDPLAPFFVADPNRTYLVEPHQYTVITTVKLPGGVTTPASAPPSAITYQFETFYHPYARTFLRELEIGGVSQLMSRDLQTDPQKARAQPQNFDFHALYASGPNDSLPYVATPYPGQIDPLTNPAADPGENFLDFAPASSGAYALYNWEVFYHAPMFVAAQLMQNNKFQDAMTWLEYIFNPSDRSAGPSPQRYWQMAPLNAMQATDWTNQQITTLLTILTVDTYEGFSDAATADAIKAWIDDPFDPHAIASTRIAAYGKSTVMKFLDNLIAWGDWYYAQYTAEMVAQAEQLYILADMILGPKPEQLPLRTPDQIVLGTTAQQSLPTYASLQKIDLFSNALVNVENAIIVPPRSSALTDTAASSLPQFPVVAAGRPLFCIPPNDKLLAYWGTVAQRLYNIRHCLNLQGVAQPLPLYAPPLDTLQLIAARTAGAAILTTTATAPIYRFNIYLQKAVEFVNDVRAYSGAILSAIEKKDAEALAALRAGQELDIQTLLLDVKTRQVTEAQDQVAALQNQRAVTEIRYDFYSTVPFMNAWEATAGALHTAALTASGAALTFDIVAGIAHLIPTETGGIQGWGGSPAVTAAYGGVNVGNAASAWGSVARDIASALSESGSMAATMGGYQRRQDEWTLQANLAQAERTQIDSQIVAANERLNIAQSELSIQQKQIENAQALSDFLQGKFTNADLYSWMISQLTAVHTQAYQLAFSLALQAQTAYQYELGRPATDQFVQFGYWDSQYKGLTAADNLLFDLRRMEAQYLAANVRELELTKHISLALTEPMTLVKLLQTGTCQICLDESLFDLDHPGHYFRRLRSVALSIPCVIGPYTSVNATLTLDQAVVRTVAPSTGYQPCAWPNPTGPNVIGSPTSGAPPVIATSGGQNDAGLFEVNLRDERWLPFEGQGAISKWTLTLDRRDNSFDVNSISDVILHLRYSARSGGDVETVRAAVKPGGARSMLISARSAFGDAYYRFFNPSDAGATAQTLTLPLTSSVFPFSNLGTPSLTDVTVVIVPAQPLASGTATALGGLPWTFGPSSSLAPPAVTFTPLTGPPPGNAMANALQSGAIAESGVPGALALTLPLKDKNGDSTLPDSLKTTVNGQALLDPKLVSDIVFIVRYKLS